MVDTTNEIPTLHEAPGTVMPWRRLSLVMLLAVAAGAITALAVLALGAMQEFAQGLLAGVFLVAGVTKLRARDSFSETLTSFGIDTRIVPVVAVGLPVVELMVAAALLPAANSVAAAVAALSLLLVFTGAMANGLIRGRTTDCGCFGKGHPGPLTDIKLVQNGVLVGLAAGVTLAGLTAHSTFGQRPTFAWLAALGLAVPIAAGLWVARTGKREPNEGSTVAGRQGGPVQLTDAAVTRRRWIGAAGGAGLVGVLGLLDSAPASAVGGTTTASRVQTCGDCVCVTETCYFHIFCVCDYWFCVNCTGFSGGGVVQTSSGTAQASFFGDKVQLKGRKGQLIGGALSWFDSSWQGTGLLLQSTRVTSYRRVPGTAIRELVGLATANGKGKHKFVLRVVDSGKPGSGLDTVNLSVSGVGGGGAGGTGSHYIASGNLIQGDLTVKLQTSSNIK